MLLDLSKHAEQVGNISEEEITKALAEKHRPLEAGVHEVVIKDFQKMKPRDAKDGTEEQVLVFSADPNWVQFCLILENAAEEQTRQTIMIPIGGTAMYVGKDKDGKAKEATGFPFKSYTQFLGALGFDAEINGERADAVFSRAVVRTNGSILNSLLGMQLKVKVDWNPKAIHPYYDKDQKCYWLVNNNGEIPNELAQPFEINKDVKGEERWAEMALACKRINVLFQSQPNTSLLRHDTVVNDLTPFLPVTQKPTMGAAKTVPTTVNKPTPKTVTKPPMKSAILQDSQLPE